MKRIVILGAGTAGTMMANRLARLLPEGWQVVLIDRDDVHLYQPGLLFLPFGATARTRSSGRALGWSIAAWRCGSAARCAWSRPSGA